MEYFSFGELFAKTAELTKERSKVAYAPTSQFYNKIMEDGNIFNPYIHRRWITSQFCKLLKLKQQDENIVDFFFIRQPRNLRNIITDNKIKNWFNHECDVMETLQRKDPIAFEERSTVLTLDDLRDILKARVDFNTDQVFYSFYYPLRETPYLTRINGRNSYEIKKENAELLKEKIDSVKTYKELKEINELFNDWESRTRRTFDFNLYGQDSTALSIYLKQGAYYTIRNLVTFNGVELDGKKGQEAIDLIKSKANQPAFVLIPIAYEIAKAKGLV